MATFSLTGKLGLDASSFVSGAKQAEGAIGDVGDKLDDLPDQAGNVGTKSGGLLSSGMVKGFAMAGGAAALGAAFKSTIDAASNLEESTNAVNVAFGDAGAAVLEFGDDSARAYGMSKNGFNEAAVGFSAFAETIAGAGGDTAGTLESLIGRSTDFASVMNMDVPQAADAFRSALSGEAEPLKRFGINISDAAVTAYALEAGMVASAGAMTDAIKVQARYGLLMQETDKFAGDFANTSDGLANSQKIMAAELENFQAAIGQKFLPQMAEYVGIAGDLLSTATSLSELDFGSAFDTGADSIAGLADQAMSFMTLGLSDYMGGLVPSTQEMGDAIRDASTGFGLWGDTVAESAAKAEVAARINENTYSTSIDTVAASIRMAEHENRNYSTAQDMVTASIEDAIAAHKENTQAIYDMQAATRESISNALDYESATLSLAQSIDDIKQAEIENALIQMDGTRSIMEKSESTRNLRQDQIDLIGEVLATADAYNLEVGASEGSAAATQNQIDALAELAGQYPAIAGDVETFIDELLRVPGTVDPAAKAIGEAIPGGVGEGIDANTPAATSAQERSLDETRAVSIGDFKAIGVEITDDMAAGIDGNNAPSTAAQGSVDRARGVDIGNWSGIGSNMMAGIRVGIDAGAPFVAAAAAAAVSNARAAAVNMARIQSPSRLFAEDVGQPISAGIAAGIGEDAWKLSDELERAIDEAEKVAMQAAEELVDNIETTLDGLWDSIDDTRSLEDMQQAVIDAEKNLREVMADYTSTAEQKAKATERVEDANYRLAKATTEMIGKDEDSRASWEQTAKAAGLTRSEIDKLTASYLELAAAQATASGVGSTVGAEAAIADAARKEFATLASQGLISGATVDRIAGIEDDPGKQIAAMKAEINQLAKFFGEVPRYAGGGWADAGSPYIVGEDGPELFVPSSNGNVITAHDTAAMFSRSRAAEHALAAMAGQGTSSGTSLTVATGTQTIPDPNVWGQQAADAYSRRMQHNGRAA